MAIYSSASEYAARQAKLLENTKIFKDPFELAVRTVLGLQSQRIFDKGQNQNGGTIGQYDTSRSFYVNPKKAPRAVGLSKAGYNLQGLLPTRGNPDASLIVEPGGEHIFTGLTAHRGGKGTKAGDPHKTTYVKNMKDYRNRIGRRVDKVNLELTGDLRLDWSSALLGKERAKVSGGGSLELDVKLKRSKNVDKLANIIDKYGEVFHLTKGEKEAYFKSLAYELRRVAQKAASGA